MSSALQDFKHIAMDVTIAGHDGTTIRAERLASNICDPASGLLHYQTTGSHIPRIEIQLPIAIQASTGHLTEIQRCRAIGTE
jgi:hypothetical protein